MKLITIMYLHESQKFIIFWLNLFASSVKLLYKLGDIWGVFHEKSPKVGSKCLPR